MFDGRGSWPALWRPWKERQRSLSREAHENQEPLMSDFPGEYNTCLTTPRSYMAAASAFHLFDLPAGAKAADGLYETEVVEAQEAE